MRESTQEREIKRVTGDPLAPTIFHEPWWLDAATQGQWEEVTVSLGGQTVGRLPFRRKRRLGMTACEMPDLVHFLGPAINEGSGGSGTRALRREQITRELIHVMPRLDHFSQRFHGGVPDTLPFLHEGYQTTVGFTIELAPAPEEVLWRRLRDKTRNVIRRAQEQTHIVDLEPDEFSSFYEDNLRVRGRVNHMFSSATGTAVFKAAVERQRGRLLASKTKPGSVTAAIFFVWDDRASHYLLTTRTPDAHNGCVSLLIWEAVRASAAQGRIFDFGGVGSRGASLLYAGFGGEVRPRYQVNRTSFRYAVARDAFVFARNRMRLMRRLKPAEACYE